MLNISFKMSKNWNSSLKMSRTEQLLGDSLQYKSTLSVDDFYLGFDFFSTLKNSR